MKITNTNYINQTYTSQTGKQAPQQQTNRPAEETAGGPTDSIKLSSTTRDMQKIAAASESTSPEREKLVQDLKAQVENNQYTVNAEQVAEKMIGHIFNQVG